jgi:putative aldouronate transport system substrate-binding protein
MDLERLGQYPPELKLIDNYKMGRSKPIVNVFSGLPTRSIARLVSQLSTYEEESLIEFVNGRKNINTWNEYVSRWYNQGGRQLTDEVNEWYKVNK